MDTIAATIREKLLSLGEEKFADFQAKLIPTVPRERIIGVRTPDLRRLAKELAKDESNMAFLDALPHQYLEENTLHALLIEQIKDFAQVMEQTERFLPYIDNWATCDIFAPKIFKKHYDEVYGYIQKWLQSEQTYTVRFAVDILMGNYLDEQFKPEIPELIAAVESEEYYINMACAWYWSVALVKQYPAVIGYFTAKRLPVWVHNKALQKARESYRISAETKEYLQSLKIK